MSKSNDALKLFAKYMGVFALASVGLTNADAGNLKELTLAKPFGLKLDNSQIVKISGLVLRADNSEVNPEGKIYFESFQYGGFFAKDKSSYIPYDQIYKMQYHQVSGKDSENFVTVENGRYRLTTYNALAKWCGGNVDPTTDPKGCNEVLGYIDSVGNKLPLYGLAKASLGVSKIFNNESEIEGELTRVAQAEAVRMARMESEKRMAMEANREQQLDKQRRLAAGTLGTQDFCTSLDLLDSNAPVRPSTLFNCGRLDKVSVGELQNAGWGIQLNGRTPTQGMVGVADSVNITVTKQR